MTPSPTVDNKTDFANAGVPNKKELEEVIVFTGVHRESRVLRKCGGNK